jgi:transcriptional regulator with XRE-family HTH domain
MDARIRLKLAQRIKELRKKLALTQEKLSELSGIDYKYIQKIESKNPPNIKLETIERLAKTLKTTPSKLLNF